MENHLHKTKTYNKKKLMQENVKYNMLVHSFLLYPDEILDSNILIK